MPAGFSDSGDRVYQEDAWLAARREGAAIALVCDGMGGGGSSGRPAADLAVEYVAQSFRKGETGLEVFRAIELANREIRTRANAAQAHLSGADTRWNGMGTTAEAVLFTRGRAVVGHVGDGRVYCRRSERASRVERITTEHTLVNEYRKASLHLAPDKLEALLADVPQKVIVRALGMTMDVPVDRHDVSTAPGDIFVVCSDGVVDRLDDAAIDAILDDSRSEEAAARALVLAALACPAPAGEHRDNTTAVVHIVGPDGV